MVPNKFSTVDLEGIDIVESQGIEIPGLYQKLTDAIMQCRYQVIYNWKFDGILIPPANVEMSVVNNEVKINSRISVTEDDILHVYSLEIPAILEELNVTSNGTYTPPEGVDGYDSVSVDVQPPLEEVTITENGEYLPSEGYYGIGKVITSITTGVPILTRAEWNALSVAQKQAYALLAIQDANSGFDRGELVYGADYVPGYYDVTPDATSGPPGTRGTWTPSSGYNGYYTEENIPDAYFLLTYNIPFTLGKIKFKCFPINRATWEHFLEYYDVNAQEWVEAYSTDTPQGTLDLELTISNAPTVNAIRWRTTTMKTFPYNILIPTFGAMELQ